MLQCLNATIPDEIPQHLVPRRNSTNSTVPGRNIMPATNATCQEEIPQHLEEILEGLEQVP